MPELLSMQENAKRSACAVRGSHAIVSSSVGPEYYVSIMSFVDKAQLEPGCTILLHNKARPLATLCRCPVSTMCRIAS